MLQKLDAFVADCYAAAAHLMTATDEITRVDALPCSVYEAKMTFSRHEQHIRTVLEQPQVRRILDNGKAILDELSTMIGQLGSGILFRYVRKATAAECLF